MPPARYLAPLSLETAAAIAIAITSAETGTAFGFNLTAVRACEREVLDFGLPVGSAAWTGVVLTIKPKARNGTARAFTFRFCIFF